MKLKEFADKYKCRAYCAAALGIETEYLAVLISRNRDFMQLKGGEWVILSHGHKLYNIDV